MLGVVDSKKNQIQLLILISSMEDHQGRSDIIMEHGDFQKEHRGFCMWTLNVWEKRRGKYCLGSEKPGSRNTGGKQCEHFLLKHGVLGVCSKKGEYQTSLLGWVYTAGVQVQNCSHYPFLKLFFLESVHF
jgi:hypothetical protein